MSVLGDIFTEADHRLSAVELAESYEREPSSDPASFPALQLFDSGEESAPESGDTGAWLLRNIMTLEGYVEGGSGAEAHDQLLELHAQAVTALCGDGNLGGLVESIEIIGQRRTAVSELAAERRLSFAQDVAVTYATVRGNPGLRA